MSSAPPSSAPAPAMLTRDELLRLFSRFHSLTSQPDVKKRIADAVKDKQEAVAVTTTIQEEIFHEMGIDPRFGIACLGKVNVVYENDMDLMIQFYRFVAKEDNGEGLLGTLIEVSYWFQGPMMNLPEILYDREEMAIDEAELEPDEFEDKMYAQQKLQELQLEMLKQMRKYQPDEQCAVFDILHNLLEESNFDSGVAILAPEQIQEVVRRRQASSADASK